MKYMMGQVVPHTVFPMKQLTVWPHRVSSETIVCDDETHTVFPVKHSYISILNVPMVKMGLGR